MKRFAAFLTVLVSAFGLGQASGASFQGLGDLPGGSFHSRAYGLSADGSVVVGYGDSASGSEAFRWTADAGIVGLGDLLGGTFNSNALGISADGSVVVGYGNSSSGREAFRWTAGGMVGLGDLAGGIFYSEANSVSADGLVVVGHSNTGVGTWEAFRWTAEKGMVGLGDLPGGNFSSYANDVSTDGSVVVGKGYSPSGAEAFRWTVGGAMVGLGDLPGGNFYSEAAGLSADGSVVVGVSEVASGREAFRWTPGGGMVGLGDLPGGSVASSARDVSGNGSVVVGQGESASATEAFIWDATAGMRGLKDVLTGEFGLDLSGWALAEVEALSENGLTIVGTGVNPSGHSEAWIAILDPLRLHWTCGSGGAWDDTQNWDLAVSPVALTEVFVDPATGVTVTGPAATATVKSLTVGAQTSGTATLLLQDTGTLEVIQQTTVTARGRITGSGTLAAGGGIANNGEIDLDTGSLQLVGGTLTNHGLLRGNGRIDNTLSNASGGEVRGQSGQRLLLTGPGNTNSGEINLGGGTIEFRGDLVNNQDGFISGRGELRIDGGLINHHMMAFSGGFTDVYGDVNNDGAGSVIVVSGGSTTTFFDDVHYDGEICISIGCKAVFFGDLSGGGPITGDGTAYVEGDLRPGNSPAEVFFGGDLAFGSAARLQIELADPALGPANDLLNVAGEVYLNGTLILSAVRDLGTVGETTRTIIEAAEDNSIIGDFSRKPSADEYLDYGVFYKRDAKTAKAYEVTVFQASMGDADGDGDVDLDDLSLLDDGWDPAGTLSESIWTDGDFDFDGDVDLDDLSHLDDNWSPAGYAAGGRGGLPAPGGATAVPEPGTLLLLLIGLVVLFMLPKVRRCAA